MKTGTCLVSSLSLLFSVSAAALADPWDGQPKVLLHLGDVTSKNACDAGGLSDCHDAVTSAGISLPGSGPFHYAYVLAAKGILSGVASVQCGLFYELGQPADILNGRFVDILSWTLCADAESRTTSPAWPAPFGGNTIEWNAGNCQTGPVAVAGYFYMAAYSSDLLRIWPHPVTMTTTVTSCTGESRSLSFEDLGIVAFSATGQAGFNPCCSPDEPCGMFPYQDSPRPGPKIMVHVTGPVSKNACTYGGLINCRDANTHGGLYSSSGGQYAYLLAVRNWDMSLAGVQCGIFYDNGSADGAGNHAGLDIFSWVRCADLEFPMPSWPAPGSGNLITWDRFGNCQSYGNVSVAGYFYVGAYSPDILRITPHPLVGLAKLADCSAAETIVPEEDLGSAAFSAGGATAGCNPCVDSCTRPIPVEVTTWGNIKALFGR